MSQCFFIVGCFLLGTLYAGKIPHPGLILTAACFVFVAAIGVYVWEHVHTHPDDASRGMHA